MDARDLTRLTQPRTLATAIAAARIAIGTAFLVAPGLVGRPWIGRDASRGAVHAISRAFGARDVALGLGTLIALGRNAGARRWVEAGVLCDALDVVGTLASWRHLPPRGRVLVTATASVGTIAGIAIVRGLDDEEPVEVGEEDAAWVPHIPGRGAA